MKKVKIKTQYIKLDQFLKWTNIVVNGSDAKFMIKEGLVKVNGKVTLQRGKKIFSGDLVEINDKDTIQFIVE